MSNFEKRLCSLGMGLDMFDPSLCWNIMHHDTTNEPTPSDFMKVILSLTLFLVIIFTGTRNEVEVIERIILLVILRIIYVFYQLL